VTQVDRLVARGMTLLAATPTTSLLFSGNLGTQLHLVDVAARDAFYETWGMATPVRASGLPYFIGVAARGPDGLEVAREELGWAFGIRWREPKVFVNDYTTQFENGDGKLFVSFAEDGPAHMKLIVGPAGSLWDPSSGPRLHHIGLWSADLRKEVERLVREGLRLDRHSPYSAYVFSPSSGTYLELVDITERDAFYRRWDLSPAPLRTIG
jgi:hypothetical protein